MGLRMKNFDILGVHWKIWLLGGWSSQKTNIEGGLPEKGGAWTVCKFKGGLGKKEGDGVFEGGGWYPDAHYAELEQLFRVVQKKMTLGQAYNLMVHYLLF